MLFGIALVVGLILFFMDWGNAESLVSKSEVGDSRMIKTSGGKEVKDITELSGDYVANPSREKSEILFVADGPKKATGTFGKFTVSFSIQQDDLSSAKLVVQVFPESVFTDNKTRDNHLKGEDFFKVEEFPLLTFTSQSIELNSDGYLAKGQMNMLGVKKDLAFPFTYVGKGQYEDGGMFAAFQGKFTFNQVAYGMDSNSGVADEVAIEFYVEMIPASEAQNAPESDDFDDFDDFEDEDESSDPVYQGDELDELFDKIEQEASGK